VVLSDDAVHSDQKWSLHQYNCLAGSRKTVPLACRSEDWIKIQTQNSRWLPPVVKTTVRIFSSRTDLPQSLPFHTACWVSTVVQLHSIWYRHPKRVTIPDARSIQLSSWRWAQQCSKRVEEWNKCIKINNLCINFFIKDYHYIRMHRQQNIKESVASLEVKVCRFHLGQSWWRKIQP